MVLVFSENANGSPQVKREVERAVSKRIPIIPMRIENVRPTRSLEYYISTAHWLDAFTPPLESHLHYLAGALRRILNSPNKLAEPEQVAEFDPAPFHRESAIRENEGKRGIWSPVGLLGIISMVVLLIAGYAYLATQRSQTESKPSPPLMENKPSLPPLSSGSVTIRSSSLGEALCIDLASGGTPRAGQSVVGWHCHGDENQRWVINNVGQGQARLVHVGGLCLDLAGVQFQNKERVTVTPCDSRANQRFVLSQGGTIRHAQTGQCLVANYPPEGVPITLGSCTQDPNAHWDIH